MSERQRETERETEKRGKMTRTQKISEPKPFFFKRILSSPYLRQTLGNSDSIAGTATGPHPVLMNPPNCEE